MPRSVASVIQNNFSKGLITEATGLNFPDNAVTEAYNTVFEKIGRVRRRLGIDVESGAETQAYEDSDGVLREFVWQSVANTGGFTFLVMQVGFDIQFYELTVDSALSAGVQPAAVDLRDFQAAGSTNINNVPASFAAGAGYLFVAHPNCDPILVRFNAEDNVFEVAKITLLIRDFEGVPDGLSTSTNPTTLTNEHSYNLRNQGWNKKVRCGAANNELGGNDQLSPSQDYPLDWNEL